MTAAVLWESRLQKEILHQKKMINVSDGVTEAHWNQGLWFTFSD